ncbi:uncharacterized protein JCM15063_003346 [Sporobolomyces koalae]|uniref:uncharacterized protein n=1 Tax=Sporobolomyces koalae TaxID=500713 RepID=UPI00316CD380
MNTGAIMTSPGQHRRRVSMPSTPPETPLDGYFDKKQTMPPPVDSTHIQIYPDSPPITPERLPAESQSATRESRAEGKRRDSDKTLLPTHGARKPSIAYAHHRRTSTATIIRLAVARQGFVLTPSKVAALFLIAFSAVYLASFLPGPLAAVFHGSTRPPKVGKTTAPSYYSPPAVPLNNKPHQRTMPIGETAQRRAWEDSFPHRIPPQQHVVPVHSDSDNAARSFHGDIYRAHPELLISHTGTQARRRPMRFGRPNAVEEGKSSLPANADHRTSSNGDSSFDEAARSPRQAAVPAERQAQMNRLKKMSAAQQADAKVGHGVASGASDTLDERIHVEGGQGSKRKVKNLGGTGGRHGTGASKLEPVDDELEQESRGRNQVRTVDDWAELEDGKAV